MLSQHLEWPVVIVGFVFAQTLALVNIYELMNQFLGVILMLISIAWIGVQIWSKIKLTNKELEDDE